jgi:flagellar biosynthesis protein FlhB
MFNCQAYTLKQILHEHMQHKMQSYSKHCDWQFFMVALCLMIVVMVVFFVANLAFFLPILNTIVP